MLLELQLRFSHSELNHFETVLWNILGANEEGELRLHSDVDNE